MKLEQAIEEFMLNAEMNTKKGTMDFYTCYTQKVFNYFGDIEITTIDRLSILRFLKSEKVRNPAISNATLNKAVLVTKGILKYSGVILEFSKLKEKKNIMVTITPKVINKLFTYYEGSSIKTDLRNYIYIRLLYDTGLRLNEMNNILLSNVDLELNTILVTVTKTDLDRYVFFTDETKYVMLKYMAVYKPSKTLIVNTKHEKMSTSSVESFISRIKKKLSIDENICPHQWRHTFATQFLRNGGNIRYLQVILGHSRISSTERYTHPSKGDLLESYRVVHGNGVSDTDKQSKKTKKW